MTISVGYIIGHICEFMLFIYFANTNFYSRRSYVKNGIISLFGYIILCAIGSFGKAPVSILSFFIVNVVLLTYCYNLKLKSAIFYSIVLDMLSTVGEYIIAYISGIALGDLASVTPHQAMAVTIGGKLIYLTGILFLKRFTGKKTKYDNGSEIVLAIIPVLTIVCLTTVMRFGINEYVFLMICIVFLIINFVTFYINAGLNDKNMKLKIIQEEYNKNKAELSEYQLLYEKYENTKIMRHDLHKQLDVLKQFIATDNVQAKEYMRQIQFSQRELDYTRYTDNKILNILFAQKVKECHKRGIEIHIHSQSPVLSFISDIDTVAIFSNMLDNAIEASETAEEKEIYVDLYTVNNSFSTVKIENHTGKDPAVIDGMLRTQKENTDIHGMGIKSINNALKKYGSELTWTYDKDKKYFRAVAMMHIPSKNSI